MTFVVNTSITQAGACAMGYHRHAARCTCAGIRMRIRLQHYALERYMLMQFLWNHFLAQRSPGTPIRAVLPVCLGERSLCGKPWKTSILYPPDIRQWIQRSKYGDNLITKNGNSSVASTRTENLSTTSVLRLV